MDFSGKTISAMTVGLLVMMRQLVIDGMPLPSALGMTEERADSMSAAVVPGAKFDAWTVKGPAVPRIEKPEPVDVEERMLACAVSFIAFAMRLVRAI